MYQYRLWVRINQLQTIETLVHAANDSQALMIGQAQYGQGNVLNYTRIYD